MAAPVPSATSRAVALTRAAMTRPHTPAGDPEAQGRLCLGMPALPGTGMRLDLEARTRFVDDQVLGAIAGGLRQVVVLGAGYDDRALRFRSPGVRFFEIDHPGTQQDKRRRVQALARAGDAVFGPADFRADDVGEVLSSCGHDPGEPTLFICEGLLVYLDRATITRLLLRLSARAAPGSVLAASLAVHDAGVSSSRVVAVANARRRTPGAEPWLTILPADEHLALLGEGGWCADRATDAAELGGGAGGHSLLVSAHPAARLPTPRTRSEPGTGRSGAGPPGVGARVGIRWSLTGRSELLFRADGGQLPSGPSGAPVAL